MAKAGIVRYGRVSATRQDAAGRKRVMTQWVSALALISLLLASCGRTQPPAPPPGEGVRLAGEPDSPAADHLLDMPPVGVDPSQVENGILLTRLDVRIAPDATVAQINEALGQVNGGIVSMSPGHLTMTVAVPRQASIEALQTLVDTLNHAVGIRYASIAQEIEMRDSPWPHDSTWPFPTVDTFDYNFAHHLVPTRFPAAWILQKRLEGCESKRVPVLIADIFSPTPPGNFRTQIPGFPAIVGGDNVHGYYVTSLIASKWDDQDPTGAYPFIECLDLRPINLSGLSAAGSAAYIPLFFPSEKFILNASFGFRSNCNSCTSRDIASRIDTPYVRAKVALIWKEWTHGRWNDFIAVVGAGNQYDAEIGRIYDGLREASYDGYMSIVAREDPFFSFVTNDLYWNPSASFASFPSLLIRQPEEMNALQTSIRDKGMDRIPSAPNVLIVGSTTSIVERFPDMITVSQSSFSNRNSDVLAVGENMRPTCRQGDSQCTGIGQIGTSYSAPQVSGLAAYLWLLSDELREKPASVTRQLIQANTRTLPSGVAIIDAYASVLSLDGTFPRSQLSTLSTPNRFALLDVNNDIKVDEQDIEIFLAHYFENNGESKDPAEPVFEVFDLNGDGYTGGKDRRDRFDLDRIGSTQFGASNYTTNVVASIEDETVTFDENAVTDLEILCYYMYSPLYFGDTDRREELLRAPCLENAISPETVTLSPGEIQQFTAFLPGTDPVSWVAECGTITEEGLYTACDTEGIYTIQAGRGDQFAQADVFVEVLEDPAEPTSTPTNTPTSTPTSTPTATPTFTPTPTATPQVLTYNSVTHASPTNSGLQATITITFTGENGTQTHTAIYPHATPIESFDTHEITMVQHAVYQVTIDYQIREGGYFLSWATATSPVSDRNCTVIGQPSFPGRVENGRTIRWRPGTIDPNSMQEVPLAGQITFELRCDR